MCAEPQKTKFASFERANNSTIQIQKKTIDELYNIRPFLDNIPVFILILNKNRQIVFANKYFLDFIGTENIYGMRTGECVNCIHAWEEEGGCGTSEFCSECGAVKAILNSQSTGFDKQECRITQQNNDVLDLNIWSKSIEIENEEFILFSLSDISGEKRRKVLERIFFHDILNTAGSLNGFIEILRDSTDEELKEYLKVTEDISNKLIDEIKSQRTLTQAEDGELELDIDNFSTKELLEEIILLYEKNQVAENKKIIVKSGCIDTIIETDKIILRRVMSNLTKNALEASKSGETVTLNCKELDNTITFYVKNNSYIPKNIQLQLFQRSFSTKGVGRGIGTYSVKLLTERYLKGKVNFKSDKESGTVFMVSYPRER